MIEQPVLAETAKQSAAVIHLAIPREQIKSVMGPAIEEVLQVLSQHGKKPAGPLFAHHLDCSSTQFDLEVGFPIDGTITPAGRVKMSALPAAQVARTVYRGPYEGLHEAWSEFGERLQNAGLLEQAGLERGATLWERYVVGPETTSDPAGWRTELNLPLTKRARA